MLPAWIAALQILERSEYYPALPNILYSFAFPQLSGHSTFKIVLIFVAPYVWILESHVAFTYPLLIYY